MAAKKKKGLGRGLDALLGSASAAPAATASETNTTSKEEASREIGVAQPNGHFAPSTQTADKVAKSPLQEIPVDLIRPGKYQPRRDMHPDALEELAASIKAQGLMQPIVIRPVGDGQYEIIAGERRWRASQIAGLHHIPALIKEVPDEAAIAMALIENIQREDLNPMEEAMALQRLQSEFELTHQEIAEAIGKSRTTVTNLLRLNQLQPEVRTLLERGDLEVGHAKALLGLIGPEQTDIARKVVSQGLTVRQTEALVRGIHNPVAKPATKSSKSSDTLRLERDLSDRVGLPVDIAHRDNGKGVISFSYSSTEELEGLLGHIS